MHYYFISDCKLIAHRILLNLDSTQLSIEEMPSAIVKYDKLLVDKKIGEVLCLKYRLVSVMLVDL